MQANSRGVQTSEHRDATQDCLSECSYERRNAQQEDRASNGRTRTHSSNRVDDDRNKGKNGNDAHGKGKQSIAELDVLMPRLFLAGCRHVRAFNTFRPRRATQSRPGESNNHARDHDGGLSDEVDQEHTAHPARNDDHGDSLGFTAN